MPSRSILIAAHSRTRLSMHMNLVASLILKKKKKKKNLCGFWNGIWWSLGFPGGSVGIESACNAGDLGSIPGLGRSPGWGHGNPLQYTCLENPYEQRSLAGRSPWGCKESDNDWVTKHTHMMIFMSLDQLSNLILPYTLIPFPLCTPNNLLFSHWELFTAANITAFPDFQAFTYTAFSA